jgi:hypothetical protein
MQLFIVLVIVSCIAMLGRACHAQLCQTPHILLFTTLAALAALATIPTVPTLGRGAAVATAVTLAHAIEISCLLIYMFLLDLATDLATDPAGAAWTVQCVALAVGWALTIEVPEDCPHALGISQLGEVICSRADPTLIGMLVAGVVGIVFPTPMHVPYTVVGITAFFTCFVAVFRSAMLTDAPLPVRVAILLGGLVAPALVGLPGGFTHGYTWSPIGGFNPGSSRTDYALH